MRRIILGLSFLLAAPAFAQTNADPLAGPKVESAAAGPTLVDMDFEGRLRRLEVSPEEAGLNLLKLTEEERNAADGVVTERAATVDKIVGGNIELLVKISGSRQAGDRTGQIETMMEVYDALKPLRERGPLLDELAAVLPSDKADELRRLVNEYRAALRSDLVAEAKAKGERLRPRQARVREHLALLGQEIKRSYDRQIAAGTAHLEQVIQRLKLSAEQEGKVRNLVLDYVQKTMGMATEDQKRDLFVSILAHLDAAQRRELLRIVVQGR